MVDKKHLRVIVGSPGDVQEERDLLDDVIGKINLHIANPKGLHLDLIKWENNSYPDFHPDGTQGILDPILDFPNCDIFIGIFWHKFGTPTKDGKTGTQHEFDEAVKEWKKNQTSHIMFYFNQKPYSPTSDKEIIQWGKVLKFKKSFPEEGLYWTYNGKEEFKEIIQNHLANLLNQKYTDKLEPKPKNPELSPRDFTRPEKFDGEHDIFVGREDQIEQIVNHMNDFFVNGNKTSRIVTIWGMGGIGKSSLAFHAMHKFEETHKIQIIPLYFESHPTLDDVLNTIAMHLNVPNREFVGRDKLEVILSRMQERSLLVYADALESVSDPEQSYLEQAIQIRKSLQRLPSNVMILGTSRASNNHLSDEKTVPLDSLDMDSAVELFARITKTDPESERDNIEKIASLAANHPLAIEIISYSYERQGLTNLLSDIQEYGITASMPDATDQQRHHTVESCIAFSFTKIDTRYQILLKNLAQLHSPFSNEMVQEVFGATSSDLPYLYNRTMITKIVRSDYEELNSENMMYDFHSLVREYLRKNHIEKLDYLKLSQYYLKFLNETYDSLKDNYTSQKIRQLNVLLESEENDIVTLASINDGVIQKDSSSCFTNVGLILDMLGHYSKSLFYHSKSLKIDTNLGDKGGIGADYSNIGIVLKNMGQLQEALNSHNKALDIRTNLGDTVGIGRDHSNIGNVLSSMGKYPEALNSHNKALDIRTNLGDTVGIGRDYTNIGIVLNDIGKYPEALNSHNKALDIHTKLGDTVAIGANHSNIGIVLNNIGKYPEALNSHNKALDIRTNLGDKVGLARDYTNIGIVLKNMGQLQEALNSHNKALEVDTKLGNKLDLISDHNGIGTTLQKMNKIQEARESFSKSIELLDELEKVTGQRHPYYNIVKRNRDNCT